MPFGDVMSAARQSTDPSGRGVPLQLFELPSMRNENGQRIK